MHYFYITYLFLKKYQLNKYKDQQWIRNFYRKNKLEDLPHVTTQLPIYNEKFVVKRLITAVLAMNYPKHKHNIQILDDSTDETTKVIANFIKPYQQQGYRIQHLNRKMRTNYKAGALNYGLTKTKDDFIAVFDADFIPPKAFLKHIVPHFLENDNLAMTQTRWGYINEHASLLTKTQTIGIDGHFVIEQTARSWNELFFNFNGTGGVWNKKAIIDGGGWSNNTLTEDLHLSYCTQMKKWQHKYLLYITCKSEIPANMNAYKLQQQRWAKGSIQTAIKILPSIWRGKFLLKQKIEAVFHLTHYANHLFILLILFLHLPVMLYFQYYNTQHPIYQFIQQEKIFPTVWIVATTSSIFMYFTSQLISLPKKWLKRLLNFPILVLLGLGISCSNLYAIFQVLIPTKHSNVFTRTPKTGKETLAATKNLNGQKSVNLPQQHYHSKLNWKIILLEISFALYFLLSAFVLIVYSKSNYIEIMYLVVAGIALLFTSCYSIKDVLKNIHTG